VKKAPRIPGAVFTAWLERMGWSDLDAATRLGCGRNSIRAWQRQGIPVYVSLACAALEAGGPVAAGLPEETPA
jgi:hypothetical protein